MTRVFLPVVVLVGSLGCNETRLRPDETDGWEDTDTDSDADTDTDTLARRGCLDGELDDGWQFETDGMYGHEAATLDGSLVLGTSVSGNPKDGGVFLLSLDDWENGNPPTDPVAIGPGRTGLGFALHAPLVVDGSVGPRGLGLITRTSSRGEARLWTQFPDPGTTVDDPDGLVELDGLLAYTADFSDLDADGITDLIAFTRDGLGAVYGPLIGDFTADDLEPLPFPPAGQQLDWNDDGYEDRMAYDEDSRQTRAWLGPLADVEPGATADVTLTGGRPPSDWHEPPDSLLRDVDGDGNLEVWTIPGPHEHSEHRSVNYPGTGVFDSAEEASVIIVYPSPLGPSMGDFDGDGSTDLLFWDETARGDEHLLIPGPLVPGRYSAANGISRVFYQTRGRAPRVLGDVNGDGRDDFVIEQVKYESDLAGWGDRSLLYLGCPGW